METIKTTCITESGKEGKQSVKVKIRYWAIKFFAINIFLAGINLLTSPHYLWFLWVMAGLSLSLILKINDLMYEQSEKKTNCHKSLQ